MSFYLCRVTYVGFKKRSMLAHLLIKQYFISKVWLRMIYDNSVIIIVIYCPVNDCGLSGRNIWQSMSALNNYNSVSIYKGLQKKFLTSMLSFLRTYNSSVFVV